MSSNSVFHILNQRFNLQRYPTKENDQLRAWDAADEYLLNTLHAENVAFEQLVILNDQFGALTLPLLHYSPVVYSDSFLSHQAITLNMQDNQCSHEWQFCSDITKVRPKGNSETLIIGRVPKSKQQLSFLLSHLQQSFPQGTRLLLAGMDKHLSRGQFDLVARFYGPSRFYPGVKKARIWEATLDKQLKPPKLSQPTVTLPEFQLELSNLANVFSAEKVDIGTRFFLEQFRKLPQKTKVADLACGNGVLGLAYLRLFPNANLYFCDESFQAIASCQQNVLANFPNISAQTQTDDGFTHCSENEFELILCNPPFHQQNTIGTDIAFGLFKGAQGKLAKEGELWVIANRHLGYHTMLKKLFGNCSTVASNPKFVLLKALKAK